MFERDGAVSPSVKVWVQVTLPSDVESEVICDDLNRDGAADFAVLLWGHGNGLGASFYNRLIVLSSGESYRVRWTFKQPNNLPAKSISDDERRRHPPPKIEEALP